MNRQDAEAAKLGDLWRCAPRGVLAVPPDAPREHLCFLAPDDAVPYRRGMRGALVITAAVAALASAVSAQPAKKAPTAKPTSAVDWATGLVTARGIGLADRQAPNPAVARGPSRRTAEDAAKHALAESLPALPLASGGTLASKLTDPAIKARLDRAVAAAISIDAEPETDGSWRVTMAVPIEAVRQAIAGPRALADAGDAGTPVVIVEGVKATPAVGTTIGGLAVATVWVTQVPVWAKDAPRIHATGSKAGAISADLGTTKATDATLFVLLAD
jgi:hypothetical protein